MTHEQALGLAAQAWCQPQTSGKIMDPDLAEAFAHIIEDVAEEERRAVFKIFDVTSVGTD